MPELGVPDPFVTPEISRVDIAWICVATGDPSSLHLDEKFAQAAGYPSVVVPGTMLLGWIGQYLESWAGGAENLKRWKIRYTAPVWPGERIKLSGSVVEGAGEPGELNCEVAAAAESDGRVLAKASAVLRRTA